MTKKHFSEYTITKKGPHFDPFELLKLDGSQIWSKKKLKSWTEPENKTIGLYGL